MTSQTLNVLYQSDDNYAAAAAASICSLLTNNPGIDVCITYLSLLGQDSEARLRQVVDRFPNGSIKFLNARGYEDELDHLGVTRWRGLNITWFKLLAFESLDADRVLYLNPQTIVCGALDELVDLNFDGKMMALSLDCLPSSRGQKIGLHPTSGYFNCGVMLVDLTKWRATGMAETVRASLAAKHDYQIVDQDFINCFFEDDIKLIGPEFNFSSAYYGYDLKRLLAADRLTDKNFYSYDLIMESYYCPRIIHSSFGITGKPWERGNEHPNRQLWAKYINMTPWQTDTLPPARRTLQWLLYRWLPSWLLMVLYGAEVRRKFG